MNIYLCVTNPTIFWYTGILDFCEKSIKASVRIYTFVVNFDYKITALFIKYTHESILRKLKIGFRMQIDFKKTLNRAECLLSEYWLSSA